MNLSKDEESLELGEDVRHVGADGLLADEEPLGDLLVGQAVGEQRAAEDRRPIAKANAPGVVERMLG